MTDLLLYYRLTGLLLQKKTKSTYLAHLIRNPQQKVIIKIFEKEYAGYDQNEGSLRANVLTSLRHPHIIPMLDVAVNEQGKPYVVSEYRPQGSLRQHLDSLPSGHMGWREAIDITTQIGEALSSSHAQNVIHGNIKPENIFYNGVGGVQLTDFNLISHADPAKIESMSDLTTAKYMAPEQFIGKGEQQSDQYALACLAYELITGHTPFEAQSFSELQEKHRAEVAPSLSAYMLGLPLPIDLAILKALAKKPEGRFQDVGTFVSSLTARLTSQVSGMLLSLLSSDASEPSAPLPAITDDPFFHELANRTLPSGSDESVPAASGTGPASHIDEIATGKTNKLLSTENLPVVTPLPRLVMPLDIEPRVKEKNNPNSSSNWERYPHLDFEEQVTANSAGNAYSTNGLMPAISAKTPSVEMPSVEMPSVEMPSVEMPSVEMPSVKTPSVEMPSVKTPSVEMPSVKTPSVKTPSVKMPSVEMPSVHEQKTEAVVLSVAHGSDAQSIAAVAAIAKRRNTRKNYFVWISVLFVIGSSLIGLLVPYLSHASSSNTTTPTGSALSQSTSVVQNGQSGQGVQNGSATPHVTGAVHTTITATAVHNPTSQPILAPQTVLTTTPSLPSSGTQPPLPQPTNPITHQPVPTPAPPTVAVPTAAATATPIPQGIGSVQIDAGGSGAGSFVADENYTNPTPSRPSSSSHNSASAIDTSGVSNPAPQSVYLTSRIGDVLYTISNLTPRFNYTIRLHFAETYWTQVGKRTFNVYLNSGLVLGNFDIFATAGGADKAVVEEFVVPADSNGTITIQFATVHDNAQINGIEVLAI